MGPVTVQCETFAVQLLTEVSTTMDSRVENFNPNDRKYTVCCCANCNVTMCLYILGNPVQATYPLNSPFTWTYISALVDLVLSSISLLIICCIMGAFYSQKEVLSLISPGLIVPTVQIFSSVLLIFAVRKERKFWLIPDIILKVTWNRFTTLKYVYSTGNFCLEHLPCSSHLWIDLLLRSIGKILRRIVSGHRTCTN